MSVDPLYLAAAACFVASLALGFAAFAVLRRRPRRALRLGTGGLAGATALLAGLGAALCLALATGLRGYSALTHEEVVLTVETVPTGARSFDARLELPDGSRKSYSLAGDQFLIEARVLKWHPWLNLLGLHTAYQLDRLSGRYHRVQDERDRQRTVYPLGDDGPVDLLAWRRSLPWLAPWADAEYGSGTFIRGDRVARYEVLVSTTGLLVRELP